MSLTLVLTDLFQLGGEGNFRSRNINLQSKSNVNACFEIDCYNLRLGQIGNRTLRPSHVRNSVHEHYITQETCNMTVCFGVNTIYYNYAIRSWGLRLWTA